MKEEPLSELVVTKSLALNWDKAGAIIGISGKYIGAIFRIKPNQKIVIGRDYGQVDFLLEDADVSRKHCWIEYDASNERYLFCDTSKNGVLVNGKKMRGDKQIRYLKPGDEIQIAKTRHVFKLG